MARNNILLRMFSNPRRVQLPNGQVFFEKYERVNRHALAPTQIRIARSYVRKIGPSRQGRFCLRKKGKRRQQAAAGLDVGTARELGKRASGSKLGKMMINDAIDSIPTAYKKIKSKITNKKVKALMSTGVGDYLVNRGVELIGERFN